MTTSSTDFSKFVPGFDFLKDLLSSANAGAPHMGQWIAPTLDPQELDKRIEQLKTVQFWLEQNTRMLQASIQALEVQRMTLSTLQSMNVPIANVSEAFTAPGTGKSAPEAAAGVVDPMKWWGALTQQFADLASKALAETAAQPMASSTTTKAASASASASAKTTTKKSAPKNAPKKRPSRPQAR